MGSKKNLCPNDPAKSGTLGFSPSRVLPAVAAIAEIIPTEPTLTVYLPWPCTALTSNPSSAPMTFTVMWRHGRESAVAVSKQTAQ